MSNQDIFDARGKPFKPMLAMKTPDSLDDIDYPVLVSPKLDGIRCIIRNGIPVSRKLLNIPNDYVRAQLADVAEGLDGELMVPGGFNSVQSAIMSRHGEPDFTFNVFDWAGMGEEHAYAARYDFLCNELPEHPRVRIVEHTLAEDAHALQVLEARFLAEGFEGAMVRDIRGPYKHGRSTTKQGWLLKLKRFKDTEACVMGFKELMHNENELECDECGHAKRSHAKEGLVPADMLGALVCETLNGVEFDVGSGFTMVQRKNFWAVRETLVGRLVKYKHQPDPDAQPGASPRFPVFLGFRDRRDM